MTSAGIHGSAFLLLTHVAVVLARTGRGRGNGGRLSDWQAFTLGIVQGFTELLPISSSGHLILYRGSRLALPAGRTTSFNKTFDVALHLGTLVAVVAYFWTESRQTPAVVAVHSLAQAADRDRGRAPRLVRARASVPAAVAGVQSASGVRSHSGAPWQIAIFLAVFGVLLWVADRTPERSEIGDLTFRQTLAIGASEILAPDARRLALGHHDHDRFTAGLTRDAAARFSFLMLIPIVARRRAARG